MARSGFIDIFFTMTNLSISSPVLWLEMKILSLTFFSNLIEKYKSYFNSDSERQSSTSSFYQDSLELLVYQIQKWCCACWKVNLALSLERKHKTPTQEEPSLQSVGLINLSNQINTSYVNCVLKYFGVF